MTGILSVEAVTAGYVADIDILRDVSLEVGAGAITGLIGLNGSGKSTLMKAICGFLHPRRGRIVHEGQEITTAAPHTMIDRGISYIPQESSLFPFMSVGDNLRLPIEHQRRRGLSRVEADRRLEETLNHFPVLRERFSAQAGDLSGGQQKMLEFAKADLVRPRLCLIDEPSIGLSPKVAEDVYAWIGSFAAAGMAILLVDHNVRRVIAIARRSYVLSLGRITATGERADFEGDLHEQVRQWLGINF
jgi:branched-chain amino acid transport system ATP-binding protein